MEQKSSAVEKAQRKMREAQAYEEDNMIRLRSTREEKKEKQRLFRMQRTTGHGTVSLEDLGNLNDVSAALQGDRAGKGGKGKGRGKKGGGSALQSFQSAGERMRKARGVVDSVA